MYLGIDTNSDLPYEGMGVADSHAPREIGWVT